MLVIYYARTSGLAGALAASWLLGQDIGPVAIAAVTGASLLLASTTRGSRWYVTPAVSTFLVFWVTALWRRDESEHRPPTSNVEPATHPM